MSALKWRDTKEWSGTITCSIEGCTTYVRRRRLWMAIRLIWEMEKLLLWHHYHVNKWVLFREPFSCCLLSTTTRITWSSDVWAFMTNFSSSSSQTKVRISKLFDFRSIPIPETGQKKRKREKKLDRRANTNDNHNAITYLCVSSASKMISSKSPSNTNGRTFDGPAFGSGFWKLVCATNMTVWWLSGEWRVTATTLTSIWST